jgi:hypothetical protein
MAFSRARSAKADNQTVASHWACTNPVAGDLDRPPCWRQAPNLLLCFLSFCPALLHRERDTLPSRCRHSVARASWRSAATVCTLQGLDRSVKAAALLLKLSKNLVKISWPSLSTRHCSLLLRQNRSSLLHAKNGSSYSWCCSRRSRSSLAED